MDLIGIKFEFVRDYIENLINSKDKTYKSKAEIARALDVKPQYLNSVLNGQRNVSDKLFKKFTETFHINQCDLDNLKVKEAEYTQNMLLGGASSSCIRCIEKDIKIKNLEDQVDDLKLQLNECKKDKERLWNQIECNEKPKTKQRSA